MPSRCPFCVHANCVLSSHTMPAFNVTIHLTSDWIVQQMRWLLLPCPTVHPVRPGRQIGSDVFEFLKASGIRPFAPRFPGGKAATNTSLSAAAGSFSPTSILGNDNVLYHSRPGLARLQKCWKNLRHMLDHSTMHRGPIVGMIRILGYQPPGVSAMDYYLAGEPTVTA